MKKHVLIFSAILLLSGLTAAAPLQVEVQKLFGATVSNQTNTTIESKTISPKQSTFYSIYSSSGKDIIEPGDDLQGEIELTIDCGSADICYADYWLEVDGQRHFASGNTYYASDGETISVTVDFDAPSTGSYLAPWYRGSAYNADEGTHIDTDTFIVQEDSDGDGIADSSDDCTYTAGEQEYNGCPPPDSDGDGVPDDEDQCPDIGISEFGMKDNGCPIQDSDGDGIPDPEDAFPNDPTCSNDSDGDSVCDSEDAFPNDPECVRDSDNDGVCDSEDVFPSDSGRKYDKDSDGIADTNDECPSEPGTEEKNGCTNHEPRITELDIPSEAIVDESISAQVQAEDSDGDSLEIHWSNGDTGSSTTYTWGSEGLHEIGVTVDDGYDSVKQRESIDVQPKPDNSENQTEDNTDNGSQDPNNETETGDEEIGTEFDQQVFSLLQNLANSLTSLFD